MPSNAIFAALDEDWGTPRRSMPASLIPDVDGPLGPDAIVQMKMARYEAHYPRTETLETSRRGQIF